MDNDLRCAIESYSQSFVTNVLLRERKLTASFLNFELSRILQILPHIFSVKENISKITGEFIVKEEFWPSNFHFIYGPKEVMKTGVINSYYNKFDELLTLYMEMGDTITKLYPYAADNFFNKFYYGKLEKQFKTNDYFVYEGYVDSYFKNIYGYLSVKENDPFGEEYKPVLNLRFGYRDQKNNEREFAEILHLGYATEVRCRADLKAYKDILQREAERNNEPEEKTNNLLVQEFNRYMPQSNKTTNEDAQAVPV